MYLAFPETEISNLIGWYVDISLNFLRSICERDLLVDRSVGVQSFVLT